MSRYIIGADFDNTIASYDDLLHSLAAAKGLIPPGARKSKKFIRDQVRLLPDGEILWQKLQGEMYGQAMGQARLVDGADELFRRCRQGRIPAFIVSHKTEYANYDPHHVNLRQAATRWLADQGFFDPAKFGLSPSQVFYESTRAEKLRRIALLGCTHFIDDLEETFLDGDFPPGAAKILFNPHREPVTAKDAAVFASWAEICEYLFDGG